MLAVTQIVLAPIATSRLRSALAAHGQVVSVAVSAFPALELLWNHADSVTVRMATYSTRARRPGPGASGTTPAASAAPARSVTARVADFLASTNRTDALLATAGRFLAGRVTLTDVSLTKHGDRLAATGVLSGAALQAALPAPFSVSPEAGGPRQFLFRASAKVLGRTLSVDARLVADHGGLVIEPDIAGLFPSFLTLTVFRDPRLRVESVSAQPVATGWRISATASLTGVSPSG